VSKTKNGFVSFSGDTVSPFLGKNAAILSIAAVA
jgi:hypothetical protein